MNRLLNETTVLEQGTTVYHNQFGKGFILSITYRGKDRLIMCSFPKHKEYDWITDIELYKGTGSVTLSKGSLEDEYVSPTLESVLENLFSSRT